MIEFWVLVAIFSIIGYFILGVPGLFIGFIIGAFLYRLTKE